MNVSYVLIALPTFVTGLGLSAYLWRRRKARLEALALAKSRPSGRTDPDEAR